MKHLLIIAAAASLLGFAEPALAQERMKTAEDTYKEIEATLGMTPGYMKAYPKTGIAGAWAMTKGVTMDPANTLDPKMKSLIGIAVAAQIPCQYCVWLDTKMARKHGATEAEIAEAVAQAGLTRHWSTVINGMQIDFETFKAEFGGDS